MTSPLQNHATHRRRNFASIEALEARIAPATFVVTNLTDAHVNGQLDLREAVAGSHAGDTITFKLPAILPASGASTIVLAGTEILIGHKLTIKGPGANKLIIDGNNASRIFDIDDNSNTTDSPVNISGLAFIQGNGAGAFLPGDGGAIMVTESITMKNCVISGNTATEAGGMMVYAKLTPGTSINISGSLITANRSVSYAGGLDLVATKSITLTNSQVTGNSSGAKGGGAYFYLISPGKGITISHDIFTGNTASGGGGLSVFDNNTSLSSKVTISASQITGNTATGKGGGLYANYAHTFITGSTIRGNTAAKYGGGIMANGFGLLSITGSKVTGNHTTAGTGEGGGIYLIGTGKATIASSSVSDNNSALRGGGIVAWNGVTLNLTSSVISGNTSGGYGGGIYTHGDSASKVTTKITGCEISNNAGSYGGGVYTNGAGDVTIMRARIAGNTATRGGAGIYLNTSGVVTLSALTVTNNDSQSGDGGGIFLNTTQNFKIIGCSITGNTADYGGGIYGDGVAGSIVGSKIYGNAATVNGGGVYVSGGHVILKIATVLGNVAPDDPNTHGMFF